MSTWTGLLLSVSILLPCVPSTDAEAPGVRIVAKSDIVYIERSESGQHLNFDFLLENQTSHRQAVVRRRCGRSFDVAPRQRRELRLRGVQMRG